MRWLALCLLVSACNGPSGRLRPSEGGDAAVAPPRDLGQFVSDEDLAIAPTPDMTGPGGFNPDSACASVSQDAVPTYKPLDIVWVIDNSSSMQPAIAEIKSGMNQFATMVGGSMGLDYRIVLLSLRGTQSPMKVGGSNRYPICIPAPLAGGSNCENGTRFYHSSIDIKSTQSLEQILGTLAQTSGYQPGDDRGGEPWKDFLRADASKTFVVVTDDNARLSASQFETFKGGKDPYNTTTLPPGILDSSWNGLFDGYTFSAIYGWGDANDPSVVCQFSDGTMPASSGPTYTTLTSKTGGVRAQVCGGSSTWTSFFQQVATAVQSGAQLSCTMPLPAPPNSSTIDPDKVNVSVVPQTGSPTALGKVANAAACGTSGGWYYDDDTMPTTVTLCPTACSSAQSALSGGGRVSIAFGCDTIIL